MKILIIDNLKLKNEGELVYFCSDLCDHYEIEAYRHQDGEMYPPTMRIIYGITIDDMEVYYCEKALVKRLSTKMKEDKASLGKLMGGDNAKKGYFHTDKYHWADVVNEIEDDEIFREMTSENFKAFSHDFVKPLLDKRRKIFHDWEFHCIVLKALDIYSRCSFCKKRDDYVPVYPDICSVCNKRLCVKCSVHPQSETSDKSLIYCLEHEPKEEMK